MASKRLNTRTSYFVYENNSQSNFQIFRKQVCLPMPRSGGNHTVHLRYGHRDLIWTARWKNFDPQPCVHSPYFRLAMEVIFHQGHYCHLITSHLTGHTKSHLQSTISLKQTSPRSLPRQYNCFQLPDILARNWAQKAWEGIQDRECGVCWKVPCAHMSCLETKWLKLPLIKGRNWCSRQLPGLEDWMRVNKL